MTNGDILLRAIIANPDDDAPRLAYADWLEENDGEVECNNCDKGLVGNNYDHASDSYRSNRKCADCNGTGRVSNGYAERASLIRLQIEVPMYSVNNKLIDLVGAGWLLEKLRCQIYLRRGFVDEIHLTCEQFMQHCHAIAEVHPVTKWVLTDKRSAVALFEWFEWYDGGKDGGRLENELPTDLYNLLRYYVSISFKTKTYMSLTSANDALQQACYIYARLPLITPQASAKI